MEFEGRSDWYSPKRGLIEFLGTFSITYFPLMTSVSYFAGNTTFLGSCLCTGFISAAWAWVAFERSGSHFNPAITLAYMYLKKMPLTAGIVYMQAQTIGAAFAGGIVYIELAGGDNDYKKALGDYEAYIDDARSRKRFSFVVEFIGTLVLTFAIGIFFI